MSNYYELQPAYGRDYKNGKAAIADFVSGKDWMGDYQMGFAYCSIRDFKPGDTVDLRYSRLKKVIPLKVSEKMTEAALHA